MWYFDVLVVAVSVERIFVRTFIMCIISTRPLSVVIVARKAQLAGWRAAVAGGRGTRLKFTELL